jgi:RTX calcium-binding nonapeptide repeat (4 copies)
VIEGCEAVADHPREMRGTTRSHGVRVHRAALVGAVVAWSILMLAGPAQATRILGTNGPDRIAGTARADVIKARGGNDRVRGGRGRDRLWGGRGADRLNAVDRLRDRLVRGGPGRDVCRVDAADRRNTKGCEIVRIAGGHRRGPGGGPPGGAPPGAPPGGGAPGGGTACATPPEEAKRPADGLAQAAGDAAPTFSDAFFATTVTLNVSADELAGDQLPISIEEVCDVPQSLQAEAAQLVGGDGVALIGPQTAVFDVGGQQLTGAAATTALAGADTLSLKAQLVPAAQWQQDEDGAPVPTFTTSRADITD